MPDNLGGTTDYSEAKKPLPGEPRDANADNRRGFDKDGPTKDAPGSRLGSPGRFGPRDKAI